MSEINAIEAFVESEKGWSEIAWNLRGGKSLDIPPLGTITCPDSEAGREGGGENIYVVLKLTRPDGSEILYRKTGYYMSYDGSTWDGVMEEVIPYQKVTTFYESA